jgi:hypothetical protein
MKEIIIKLIVPDEIDPFSLVSTMMDDFYYSNRHMEDYGPLMEEITYDIVNAAELGWVEK